MSVHAVRYYVRAGLVKPTRNTSNNYRYFGAQDVLRLKFIKGVQTLGFSLAEIREFLETMDAGTCACTDIHGHLAEKIREVRAQIDTLSQRINFMSTVHETWNTNGGHAESFGALCRLLEQQSEPSRQDSACFGTVSCSKVSHNSRSVDGPPSSSKALRDQKANRDRRNEQPVTGLLSAQWISPGPRTL